MAMDGGAPPWFDHVNADHDTVGGWMKLTVLGSLQRQTTDLNPNGETSYERPSKPPTFWNSYTRTLILDTILKLSGTIGVTQKTMAYDTHVCLILLQTLNPQER